MKGDIGNHTNLRTSSTCLIKGIHLPGEHCNQQISFKLCAVLGTNEVDRILLYYGMCALTVFVSKAIEIKL